MDWSQLRGAKILMTGGTGFIGLSMLDAFKLSDADCELHVTTRQEIEFGDGRIRRVNRFTMDLPTSITHVIHLEPDIVTNVASRLLAVTKPGCRFLYSSSGAVEVNGDYYAYVKANSEKMTLTYGKLYNIVPIIARLWAFIGPHLPLHRGYAAGDFIRDAMAGGKIVVKGNGKAVRSYLYATDLAEWTWTALVRGKSHGIYNIGSEDEITIDELASRIALEFKCQITILNNPNVPNSRYVPDTGATRSELGLAQTVELPDALRMTIEWMRANYGRSEHRSPGHAGTGQAHGAA